MPRFLVDEDLPQALADRLVDAGMEAVHVRALRLEGSADAELLAHANANDLVVLTEDLDFAQIRLRQGPPPPAGLVLVRMPTSLPITQRVEMVVEALRNVRNEELQGNVLVVEPGRVRSLRDLH